MGVVALINFGKILLASVLRLSSFGIVSELVTLPIHKKSFPGSIQSRGKFYVLSSTFSLIFAMFDVHFSWR